jgi:hypothetical protein
MKKSHLAVAALVAAGAAGFVAGTPAFAAPGDPLPTCVVQRTTFTPSSVTFTVRNLCGIPQRVIAILDNLPSGACTVVAVDETANLHYNYRAHAARLAQC